MCCTTLTLEATTMATKQLMRAACCDIGWPGHDEQKAEFRTLRMNWVVVTDANGNRRLEMRWQADRGD